MRGRIAKFVTKENEEQGVPNSNVVVAAGCTATTNAQKEVYVTTVDFGFTIGVANAAKAFGFQLFTFPKGLINTIRSSFKITMVASAAQAVTPVIGIGTAMATGAVNALSGTATFEDIATGANGTVTNGTTAVVSKANVVGEVDVKDGTSSAKSAFINFAGTWTSAVDITVSGTVQIIWTKL